MFFVIVIFLVLFFYIGSKDLRVYSASVIRAAMRHLEELEELKNEFQ